jgi:hypothetical protein
MKHKDREAASCHEHAADSGDVSADSTWLEGKVSDAYSLQRKRRAVSDNDMAEGSKPNVGEPGCF